LVINHIKTLAIGEKVSVRRLAKDLKISEGTVYRAIKEAENLGLVSSIPKVGAIRIEPDVERSIDSLSYEELVSVLEGRFISGIDLKKKTPKHCQKSRQSIFDNATIVDEIQKISYDNY